MAESRLPQTSLEDFGSIFRSEFGKNPREFRRTIYDDPSPISDMLGSSPVLDLIRQALPERVVETKAGQAVRNLLPAEPAKDSMAARAVAALNSLPGGGYTKEYRQDLSKARAADRQLRTDTAELGRITDPTTGLDRPTETLRELGAQVSGVTAGDLASEGLRNIWWFINAPQALSTLAVLSAVHGASQEYRDPELKGPLIRNRTYRLATTVPAMIATSMAVGNFGRQPGFKAAVPSEADPTVSADPLGEAASRFFLGRSGSLLPYDEFVKERPDVSRGEYEAYKAYLFGNAMPIKATLEGINGPEVNFLGKSIPIATGVLPAVAAALGAGMGARRAGQALQKAKILDNAADARQEYTKANAFYNRVEANPQATEREKKDALMAKNMAYVPYKKLQDQIDREMLRKTLGYSSVALTGAALGGQTLESIRRALKGKAPVEPEEEQTSLPAA